MNNTVKVEVKGKWEPPEFAKPYTDDAVRIIKIVDAANNSRRISALGLSNQDYVTHRTAAINAIYAMSLKLAIAEDVIRHSKAGNQRGMELEYDRRITETFKS